MAVKAIEVDVGHMKTFMREIETLRKRQHRNIIKILASYTEVQIESECKLEVINILYPWADMDMDEWMIKANPPEWLPKQTDDERRKYLCSVIYKLISALTYLHKEIDGQITSHHDLKPKNILVYREELVITDFGRSHLRSVVMGSETEGIKGLGTYAYQPPEYFGDDGTPARGSHGRSFDVWAMGCIMSEVAVIIAYGWESEKVKQFRKERRKNSKTRFKKSGDRDDSFHNNQFVVEQWLKELEGDKNNQLQETTNLIKKTLKPGPEERLCSWEAKIEMHSILHPKASRRDRRKEWEETVPRPTTNELNKKSTTPMHRAAEKGDLMEVEILLKHGWPADRKDSNGDSPIQIARRLKHRELETFLLRSKSGNNSLSQRFRNKAFLLQHPSLWMPKYDSWEENLCYYVKKDDIVGVQTLFRLQKGNINCAHQFLDPENTNISYLHNKFYWPDFYDACALHLSTLNATTKIAEWLLDAGANVNQKNRLAVTPLHMAVLRNKVEFVDLFLRRKAFLDMKDKFGQTALSCAVYCGWTTIINRLFERKADPNVTDKEGMSLLHWAVRSSKKTLVKRLLQEKVDISTVTRKGYTALHIAIYCDKTVDQSIISLLLNNGANPYLKNCEEKSPFHDAVHHDKIECVQLLLRHYTPKDTRNRDTALFEVSSVHMLEKLVEAGLDINVKDRHGRTVLHNMASNGDPEWVGLLLRNGVNVNEKSDEGLTAFDEAIKSGNSMMQNMLSSSTVDQFEQIRNLPRTSTKRRR